MEDKGTIQLKGAGDPRIKDLRTAGTHKTRSPGWRKGTKLPRYITNFVLTGGGLGDYICHMPAFEYIAERQPHVKGRLFCAEPFKSVAKYIMAKYPHWEVLDPSVCETKIKPMEALITPAQYVKYVDAVGSHLLDLGFMYYTKLGGPPPEYDRMTDLSHYRSGKDWDLPESYAVLTPGYTTEVRKMKGAYLNEISQYLLDKGITPVYLGKKTFAVSGKNHSVDPRYKAAFDDDFDPSLGIDLREKTTLLECVEIIRRAKMILGIDNGLLHFAGCTTTPIIFGHTITEVRHRVVRRPKGEVINLTVNKNLLPCAGCQSNMRFIPFHDFRKCLYGDAACTDMLFNRECEVWKRAINHVMDLGLAARA